ncbi:MAG: bifunctional acetate--CoA ligase family protein/GNAT family N-acetyltransferase [Candidatus Falkowbacteria bacterium]
MKLDKLFNPKTIAVIGASDREESVGYALMKNLIGSNYGGTVYPVNFKHKSIQSIKAYKSVKDIPDKVDLALIATPAKTVPGIVEECGQAGVAGVVIISAGFKEAGREGEAACDRILELALAYGMRVIGPNCLGFIRPKLHLNASFASQMALPGKLAFISQSGALCTAILDWSIKNNVGFGHFVSIGSMIDVSFHDLIDYFGQDPETSSILIYMESLNDARKFLSAARAFSRSKPIIVLKVGRSSAGAKAAKSHTGSLAGNDAVFDAAFERAGIVRVDTTVELFHTAKALAMQPRPKGKRVAVVTNAGGPGVIATDALVYSGGEIALLSKKTVSALDKILPATWSRGNPVDILGDADADRYRQAVEICLADENTDAILVILTPQAMTDPTAVAKKLVALCRDKRGKTILASWMGGYEVEAGRTALEKGSIPIYRQPEDAIKCFMNICRYSKNLEFLYETPATIPHAFDPKTEANRKLLKKITDQGREVLTEAESKEMLANYDIPIVANRIAGSASEASRAAAELGFPVAMKILSPDIIHKTDVGGVRLNINSPEEAGRAFSEIMESSRRFEPKAAIEGVFIEPMVKKRYELLIGCQKDPIFGPAIVFGMGGVAVEVFKDTKVGLPPLNMSLSLRLISATKIYKLLKGYRGMPGVDIAAIQFLLYKFAYLLADFPEIKELDINPFAIDEHGGIVLDAKIILDKNVIGKKVKPYSHLVISPYPKEYMAHFKMKNGQKVVLRPIRPEDEPMEAEMFTHFSAETERHRFFHRIGDITHELLQRYTQVDYDREIAIVAELTEKKEKKMLGVVRLIADPYGETAEFAIVVADPWQKQGLGNKFTDYILEIARERGLKKVYASFLKDNPPMIHIFEKRGFAITYKDKIGHAELELK